MIGMFKKRMNVTASIQNEHNALRRIGTLEKSLYKEFSTKKKIATEPVKKRVIYDSDASEDEFNQV